jgi:hypothetical protein
MKKIYSSIRAKVLMTLLGVFISLSSFSQTDVLVCGACSPQSWLDDVVNKLIATASFNSVTGYNIYLTGTPTLAQLQAYDAVMVFTDYGAQDPVTMGNNLAQYIDGGGAVVMCTFATASVPIQGNFNTPTYRIAIPMSQSSTPMLTLGTIVDPCSPIFNGITSFNGGSSSYRAAATTFEAGSVTTANWSNGEWLCATRQNVGPLMVRRCDLNFYPPSSDVRSDFWSSATQGAQIMANALLWTAGVTNNANPPAAPASITGTSTFCQGGTSSFTAAAVVGASSYTWTVPAGITITSGQGTVTINVSASTAQTTTVSVVANNSCGAGPPTTYTITTNPQPTVGSSASPSAAVCTGSQVTLSGTGAVSYSWSGGITDGVPFTPVSSASYTVTGTDANGCTNTSTSSITVNPLPNVGASSTATSICAGASVTLNGTGATTYTWSHSVVDNTPFNPTSTTTYTVVGTDANGCTDSGVITVNVYTGVTVGSNPPSADVCEGGSVTLNGTGASTYTWSPAITNGQPFVPTVSGTYTVTGTDANGCFDTATVMVTVDTFPTVTASAPVTIACLNDAAFTLTGTPAGGIWFGPGVSGSTFNPAGAGAGTHMLIYGYMSPQGCGAQDTVFMTVDLCLGIAGNSADEFSVYPNPSSGTFALTFNQNEGDVIIEMVDLSGRIVYSANENNVQSGFTTQIVTENLAAGTYMLRITSANEQNVIRVSIQ